MFAPTPFSVSVVLFCNSYNFTNLSLWTFFSLRQSLCAYFICLTVFKLYFTFCESALSNFLSVFQLSLLDFLYLSVVCLFSASFVACICHLNLSFFLSLYFLYLPLCVTATFLYLYFYIFCCVFLLSYLPFFLFEYLTSLFLTLDGGFQSQNVLFGRIHFNGSSLSLSSSQVSHSLLLSLSHSISLTYTLSLSRPLRVRCLMPSKVVPFLIRSKLESGRFQVDSTTSADTFAMLDRFQNDNFNF